MHSVVVLVGSSRRGSFNVALFETMKALAPDMAFVRPDLDALPMYNRDLEDSAFPESAKVLKETIQKADGVLFITPEYNRTIPPLLTNAIAWGTRPEGSNSFKGKAGATMGATNGSIGTAPGQQHLKQILVYLDTAVMGQPEFYLSAVKGKIGTDGLIVDEKTRAR